MACWLFPLCSPIFGASVMSECRIFSEPLLHRAGNFYKNYFRISQPFAERVMPHSEPKIAFLLMTRNIRFNCAEICILQLRRHSSLWCADCTSEMTGPTPWKWAAQSSDSVGGQTGRGVSSREWLERYAHADVCHVHVTPASSAWRRHFEDAQTAADDDTESTVEWRVGRFFLASAQLKYNWNKTEIKNCFISAVAHLKENTKKR